MINFNAKKFTTCIIGFTMLIILSGCYDKTELEDRGFVMAIGIDKYEYDEEESTNQDEKETLDLVRLDAQTENPRFTITITRANLGSIVGDLEEGNYITIVDNETIAGALSIADLYANQSMYYGYVEVVVIGEDILNDKELLKETVDTLERNRGLSREVFVVTTKGQASDILTEDIKGDSLVGTFMSKIYRNNNSATKSGVFHKELESLSKSLYATESAIIPAIAIEDGHVKLDGVAIIKDMQLLDWVSEADIRGYLWVLGKGEGVTVFTEYNDVYVPLNITTNNKQIKFIEENGKIICEVDIVVDGAIAGYNFTSEGVFNEKILSELSDEYEKIIYEEIRSSFNLFYNIFSIDAFEFSETIRKKYNDIFVKFENQQDIINNIDLKLNVNVEIKSIGSIK